MDFDTEVFTAFLVHPGRPALDRSIDLPLLDPRPPARVRIPVDSEEEEEEEAAAADVYELVADGDWPREALYRHLRRESTAS